MQIKNRANNNNKSEGCVGVLLIIKSNKKIE